MRCERCKRMRPLTWRVMGHGRSWVLCDVCRPAFRRWFVANLPRAKRIAHGA